MQLDSFSGYCCQAAHRWARWAQTTGSFDCWSPAAHVCSRRSRVCTGACQAETLQDPSPDSSFLAAQDIAAMLAGDKEMASTGIWGQRCTSAIAAAGRALLAYQLDSFSWLLRVLLLC